MVKISLYWKVFTTTKERNDCGDVDGYFDLFLNYSNVRYLLELNNGKIDKSMTNKRLRRYF